MVDNTVKKNAGDLERELGWFCEVLNARLSFYFKQKESTSPPTLEPPAPGDGALGQFISQRRLSPAERIVLILALIPHIRPQLLDVLWSRNAETGRGFTEFGGQQGATHGGFVPTGETAMFILASDDLAARLELEQLFEPGHLFAELGLLRLAPVSKGDPAMSGALLVSRDAVLLLTTGAALKPRFGSEFPARLIQTGLGWEDLVLPSSTLEQLEEIRTWTRHGATLLGEWGMQAKLRPGFTALFHGPPGTGKTLSACLLGRHCGRDVYKIDLSLIVSKYVGETEKNLAAIFDQAESKQWILFFDEADALFGRRTKVSDAHDRFANQEVSFLLQRIEEFDGVSILASNMKANIDEAFLRRFHSVVFFPLPRPAERQRIWEGAFSAKAQPEERIDFALLAERHELSGGTIMNVARYASLRALSRGESRILLDDIEDGVKRELLKEGRAR